MFKDKTILITGGTGSVGKAVTKELIKNNNPKQIKIFSRSEYHHWEMIMEYMERILNLATEIIQAVENQG